MTFGSDGVLARLLVGAAVGLTSLGLTACSEDVPTDYTAAHREAFLTACSRPLDDPRLLSDICGCVYDRIEDEVPFEEFERIDDRLAATSAETAGVETDATAESDVSSPVAGDGLPVEVALLVADCFTLEADL